MDEFPQILAIFYAEFHITQGSQVLFEVPEGFTNSINDGPLKVDFDSFSEYMIPKSALCNQLVTISTTNFRIMGYPVLLQDSKYERNALLFNLCFVFEKSANILSFEQIVTKIARVLRALEVRAILNKVESEFLSNPETKSTLPNIITQIMEDLNSYHECQISVNDSNRIDLKLFPVHSEPPPVYDYQVPILITDLTKYIDRHWDITMRRIVDFVNGVNTVHKIAYKSDVDITYFGNIYATTSGINRLSESEELQNECIEFVRKPDCLAPSVGMIFSLYCSLKGNMSLLDWMRENPVYSSQVDIRRFIAFGVIHEIILRIHNYPIYYNPKDDKVPHEVLEISQYLNGQHHLDDLCTRFNKGPKEMQELLNIPQIQSIFK
ncbi:Nitrogen permease regulator 2 [Boothiomyces macroporosus]|uniref:Nitrogen permease regulator 2 n=1 Tax=Boothiomyces macroporosus TaxID=261099 RepID=A0AAD5UH73_9FUNG|nr:Nitrogen permease regulator 2 [Boothiomyces macroporosus]